MIRARTPSGLRPEPDIPRYIFRTKRRDLSDLEPREPRRVEPGNPEEIDLGWQWRQALVNAGQGGHDARHVDTFGDGNTGS